MVFPEVFSISFENYLSKAPRRGFEWLIIQLDEYTNGCSPLGPLLFIVYINDLTDNINSEIRLFAGDSSLFTVVKGVEQTHEKLVKDLATITSWAYQRKIIFFNPDITKQAIEVIISYKDKKKRPSRTNIQWDSHRQKTLHETPRGLSR